MLPSVPLRPGHHIKLATESLFVGRHHLYVDSSVFRKGPSVCPLTQYESDDYGIYLETYGWIKICTALRSSSGIIGLQCRKPIRTHRT